MGMPDVEPPKIRQFAETLHRKKGFAEESRKRIEAEGSLGIRRSHLSVRNIRHAFLCCLDNSAKTVTLLPEEIPAREVAGTMTMPFPTECTLVCRVAPAEIDLFNKLLEGYDNMAFVTTTDAAQGKMVLQTSANYKKDLLAVLRHLPMQVYVEEFS